MTRNADGKVTTKGLLSMFRELDPTAKLIAFLVLALPFTGGVSTIAQMLGVGRDSSAVVSPDSLRLEFQAADRMLAQRLDTLSQDMGEVKDLQRRAIINDYLTSGVLTESEIAEIRAKQQNQRLHLVNLDSLGDIVTSRMILKQNGR